MTGAQIRRDTGTIASIAVLDNAISEVETLRIIAVYVPFSPIAREIVAEALESISDALAWQRRQLLICARGGEGRVA